MKITSHYFDPLESSLRLQCATANKEAFILFRRGVLSDSFLDRDRYSGAWSVDVSRKVIGLAVSDEKLNSLIKEKLNNVQAGQIAEITCADLESKGCGDYRKESVVEDW